MRDISYKLLPAGDRGPCIYLRGSYRGQRFEISTGATDRAVAQKFAADYVAALLGSCLPGAQALDVTFAQAAAAYVAFRDPENYDRVFLGRLVALLGDRRTRDISHADLVGAANEILPGRANATKNRQILVPAAAVLHYAEQQAWCSYLRIPLFKVSKRSPRTPASDATMTKLLAAAAGAERAFLAVLYETGLRVTTALSIGRAPGRIDYKAGAIYTPNDKNDELIRIEISRPLAGELKRLAKRVRPDGRLFSWGDRHNVYRWLRPLCRKAGVRYTPHQSRHALATDLLERQVPDKEAADYGAWRDVRSLHRYQHVRPKRLADRSAGRLLKRKAKP